jgi:hypothetical protein
MNNLNFNQPGGFPIDSNTLDFMQKAYELFNGFGSLAGDLSIISGCTVTGNSVSDGLVYINGELLPFKAGIQAPSVIIVSSQQNQVFEDGNSKPVEFIRYATFGVSSNSYPWANFKRAFPTTLIQESLNQKADTQAVNTALSQKANTADVNTSLAAKEDKTTINALISRIQDLEEKMGSIQYGAEVNVNADWNAVSGDARILNKPEIVSPFLRKGNFLLGDTPFTDSVFTVTFAEIANANYLVAGSLVSKSTDFNNDNDVFWMIREKTSTSFKLCLREVAQITQSLEFNYVLIPY